jgi:hypothetical protein
LQSPSDAHGVPPPLLLLPPLLPLLLLLPLPLLLPLLPLLLPLPLPLPLLLLLLLPLPLPLLLPLLLPLPLPLLLPLLPLPLPLPLPLLLPEPLSHGPSAADVVCTCTSYVPGLFFKSLQPSELTPNRYSATDGDASRMGVPALLSTHDAGPASAVLTTTHLPFASTCRCTPHP